METIFLFFLKNFTFFLAMVYNYKKVKSVQKKISLKIVGGLGLMRVNVFFFFRHFWTLFDMSKTLFSSSQQGNENFLNFFRGVAVCSIFHFCKILMICREIYIKNVQKTSKNDKS